MENYRKQAEELCKNKEVRLATRLELVNLFGIETSDMTIKSKGIDIFAHFNYPENLPLATIVNTTMDRYKNIKQEMYHGPIEEVANNISDNFSFFLSQRLRDDQVLEDATQMFRDAILESFLEKFVAYVYQHDFGK